MKVTEEEVHVLRLDKDGEMFIFIYDRTHLSAALHRLGQWASNPDLAFDWYDAARLSQLMRSHMHAQENQRPRSSQG